jgi:hypothetical protein
MKTRRTWLRRLTPLLALACFQLIGTGGRADTWWDPRWDYRFAITVDAGGYERVDKPVEVHINFTQLLVNLGVAGPLDENSIRVVEVTSGGLLLDTAVVFQFERDSAYDASTHAAGILVFLMDNTTAPSAARTFHVYFDTVGKAFSSPVFVPLVSIEDDIMFQGQTSFCVTSPSGTYYYHKAGAGFAAIIDAEGRDWLGYNTLAGSAGEFRGLPNLGEVFHPGYTNSTSTIKNSGPVRVSISSTSTNGQWTCRWDIFPTYARMTLTERGGSYWFLYEGTPWGSLNLDRDYMVRAPGIRTPITQTWVATLPSPEWAYFGDNATARVFYMVHHETDNTPDQFWQMEGNMTVFGFGRQYPCCGKYLNTVPATFTIGFGEDSLNALGSINSSSRDLQIIPGQPMRRSSLIATVGVQWTATTATVTWTTDSPGTSRVQYGFTEDLELGSLENASPVVNHSITLSGLSGGLTYYLMASSVLGSGDTIRSKILAFQTCTEARIASDGFSDGELDTSLWQLKNPLGDATFSVSSGELLIHVPGGVNHDVWTGGVHAPRAIQYIEDGDFEIEAKFSSLMSEEYQIQGILVEQDSLNLLRFDFVRDDEQTRVFAARLANGTPNVLVDSPVPSTAPLFLRVRREGSLWKQWYSTDRLNWTLAISTDQAIAVTGVGVFAGNAGSPPAFTAAIDYTLSNSTPITSNLRVMLEGAFSVEADSMVMGLAGVLPLSQPYSSAPWEYNGNESVTHIPPGVIDWVLVDLRSASDPPTTVARRAAFVNTKGYIVDLDGSSLVVFGNALPGDYYATVHHRNHLSVMSSAPLTIGRFSRRYDFTKSLSRTYGSSAVKQVGTRSLVATGDVDHNGGIGASDLVSIRGSVGIVGYNVNDLDLNGGVGASDLVIIRSNVGRVAGTP